MTKHFHFGDRKADGIFSLKTFNIIAIAILIDTPPTPKTKRGKGKKSRTKHFFKLFRKMNKGKQSKQKSLKADKNKRKKLTYHEKYDWFYQTKEWRTLREERFRFAEGLCELCREKGIPRAGREVHHIIPIEDDWSKRLDFDNTILLCKDCHDPFHGRESQLQKFLKEWENI